MAKWAKKAIQEFEDNGKEIVFLAPTRTTDGLTKHTKWYQALQAAGAVPLPLRGGGRNIEFANPHDGGEPACQDVVALHLCPPERQSWYPHFGPSWNRSSARPHHQEWRGDKACGQEWR